MKSLCPTSVARISAVARICFLTEMALLTLAAGTALADPAPAPATQLTEDKPVTIKLNSSTTTTVLLPFEVEDMHGVGFTTEPTRRSDEYALSFSTNAKNRLALARLSERAVRRNLNLIVGNEVYTIIVEPTDGEVAPVVRLTRPPKVAAR